MRRKTTHKLAKTWNAILFCIAYFTIASSHAQVLSNLQNSFNTFQKENFQEKLYVHVNKGTFLTGEIIWFKVYCIDGSTGKPADISKVAYIELLDNNHAAVLQAKIGLSHGRGDGSFSIPFSVNTGNYRLSAYTNWMKNFDAGFFFEKQLTIINPLRTQPTDKASAPAYDVQFFPEGGHLVKGITSKIAFKLSGSDGKGADCSGVVIDQKNDTVARFKSLKFGIGSFTFKPTQQTVYKAVIKVNKSIIIRELPQIGESGYVMQATDHNDSWNVSVKSSDSASAAGIYLMAYNNHAIHVAAGANLVNGTASFNIEKSKLNEGINRLTLFDQQQRPLCERIIFRRPAKKLTIAARVDQQTYSTRKKVSLAISTQDEAHKDQMADLSVSVFRADALQDINSDHIAGYLWLRAELKGNIESPDYYLENPAPETDEALDNLMLSQGWTQFDWTKITSGAAPHFKFLPEYTGPIITGHITHTSDKAPAKGITAYLTIPGPPNQLYITRSDSTGQLLFSSQNFYGSKEIVVQTNSMQDSTYRIEVTNPFSDQHSAGQSFAYAAKPDIKAALTENSVNMQVQNIFSATQLKQFYAPQTDSTAFFGKPTKSYLLDNFTRFTTIEEVLREYVGSIAVAKRQGKFTIKMFNVDQPLGNPLVLIDGDPIFDVDKIFKIDPLKIKQLDVVSTNYLYGPAIFNGIMSFTTYKNDGINFDIDPHAVILDYEGLQLERKFYSPIYETQSQIGSTIPDFRNTLYWNPDANTPVNGKIDLQFYTGDKAGHYIGIIEGTTVNGRAGYQSFNFEIKK